MRVRNFVQDDAHILCTEDQIVSETEQFCALVLSIYGDFGFEDVRVKLADRPPVRAGSDAIWDRAEKALADAVGAVGLEYQLNPGDGAFYGPKLDFYLTDTIGREWQCGTLQVDFVMPERLDAEYVGEDSARHRPVMLHRAILGSLERFIGILIEEHEGKFPLWLAPLQVVVTTITSDGDDFARTVAKKMSEAGLRVELDLSNEKINYKVRQHSLAKVPAIIAIGKREAAEGSVALRRLGDKGQQSLELEEALAKLKLEARMPGTH
jgi:threonyl-tRNA synthetase